VFSRPLTMASSSNPLCPCAGNSAFPQAFTRPGERLPAFLDGNVLTVDNVAVSERSSEEFSDLSRLAPGLAVPMAASDSLGAHRRGKLMPCRPRCARLGLPLGGRLALLSDPDGPAQALAKEGIWGAVCRGLV